MAGAEKSGDAAAAAGSVLARHVAALAARRGPKRAANAPSDPPEPLPAQRTADRAAGHAIARAAERVHNLPLFLEKVVARPASVAELTELLPDQALISVVEGHSDHLGTVVICPGLLTSLIEMQAMGRISSRPAPLRRPTRTDAAICTDFINACLTDVGAELKSHVGFEGLGGYRYVNFVDDPRLLELMLEDVPYRMISVSLRAGPAGQRDGRMILMLPTPAPAAASPAIPAPDARVAAPQTGVLSSSVQTVPIELVGVLCRRLVSLGELQSLRPGDALSLPAGVLTQATLETATGQTLFRGKLGEVAGHHALRLSATSDFAAADEVSEDSHRSLGGDQMAQELAASWNAEAESVEIKAVGPADGWAEPPIADLNAPDAFRDDSADGSTAFEIPSLDPLTATDWDDEESEFGATSTLEVG